MSAQAWLQLTTQSTHWGIQTDWKKKLNIGFLFIKISKVVPKQLGNNLNINNNNANVNGNNKVQLNNKIKEIDDINMNIFKDDNLNDLDFDDDKMINDEKFMTRIIFLL